MCDKSDVLNMLSDTVFIGLDFIERKKRWSIYTWAYHTGEDSLWNILDNIWMMCDGIWDVYTVYNVYYTLRYHFSSIEPDHWKILAIEMTKKKKEDMFANKIALISFAIITFNTQRPVWFCVGFEWWPTLIV